jgi:hypothetical protein
MFINVAGQLSMFGEPCIDTLVGGAATAPPDGSLGILSKLNRPSGVAVDSLGNVYIAEQSGHAIRQMRPNGTTYLIAGTGLQGVCANTIGPGPATSLALYTPNGLAVDSRDNLFFAETSCNRIRMVNMTTRIMTVIMGGSYSNADGTPPILVPLNLPSGITFNGSSIMYVADHSNNKIWRVDFSTNQTFLAIGGSGTSYTGENTAGPAFTNINNPDAVSYNEYYNELLYSDKTGNRVRQYLNGFVNTIAGNGSNTAPGTYSRPALMLTLDRPGYGLRLKSGDAVIFDAQHRLIFRVNATTGIAKLVAGDGTYTFGGDGGPASSARVTVPMRAAEDPSGAIVFSDQDNDRVRVIDRRICMTGKIGPSLTIQSANSTHVIAVISLMPYGAYPCLWRMNVGTSRSTQVAVNYVFGVTLGKNATFFDTPCSSPTYYVDPSLAAPMCQMFAEVLCPLPAPISLTRQWAFVVMMSHTYKGVPTSLSAPLPYTPSVAVGPLCVRNVAGTGTAGTGGDRGPAVMAQMNAPRQLSVDAYGNLWVADSLNCAVRMIRPDGIITTPVGRLGTCGYSTGNGIAAQALLNTPCGVSVVNDNTILIADTNNSIVRSVYIISPMEATIQTTVGDFALGPGNTAPGSPGIQTQINFPQCVAILDSYVIIGDSGNKRALNMAGGTVISGIGTGRNGTWSDGVAMAQANFSTMNDMTGGIGAYGAWYVADVAAIRSVQLDGRVRSEVGLGGQQTGPFTLNTPPKLLRTNPTGLAMHSRYGLLWADETNHRILFVTNGTVEVLAGDGSDTLPAIIDGERADTTGITPYDVITDASGAIIFSDRLHNRVRMVDRRMCYSTPDRAVLSITNTTSSSVTAIISLGAFGSAPCLWLTATTAFESQFLSSYDIGFVRTTLAQPIVQFGCSSISITIDDALLAPTCQMMAVITCYYNLNYLTDGLSWALVLDISASGNREAYPWFTPLTAPLPFSVTLQSLQLPTTPCVSTVFAAPSHASPYAIKSSFLRSITDAVVLSDGRIMMIDKLAGGLHFLYPNGSVTFDGNGTWRGCAAPLLTGWVPGRATQLSNGNLIVSDAASSTLLELYTNCTVRRFAGVAIGAPSVPAVLTGDRLTSKLGTPFALAASGTSVYVADSDNNQIYLVTLWGGVIPVSGNASTQDFNTVDSTSFPSMKSFALLDNQEVVVGVQVDAGVRRVLIDGTVVTVVRNTTDARPATRYSVTLPVSFPGALASDKQDGFYLADNTSVWRIAYDHTVTYIGGNGLDATSDGIPMPSAQLYRARRMVVDPSGAVYFIASGDVSLRVFDDRMCVSAGVLNHTITIITATVRYVTAVLSMFPYGSAPCFWNPVTDVGDSVYNAQIAMSSGFSFGVRRVGSGLLSMTSCQYVTFYAWGNRTAPRCQMLAQMNCTLPLAAPMDTTPSWEFVLSFPVPGNPSAGTQYVAALIPLPYISPTVSPSTSSSMYASVTPTMSKSPSISNSGSISTSATWSGTPSMSPSSSASGSLTITPSLTRTISASVTTSTTPSMFGSLTGSVTLTTTSSISPSITQSITATRGASSSNSVSMTSSLSLSPSNTASIPGSVSPSPSVTRSGSTSGSESLTPSYSMSASPTAFMSATLAMSLSFGQSPSPTNTQVPSPTSSWSRSSSGSLSPFPSQSTYSSTAGSTDPSPSSTQLVASVNVSASSTVEAAASFNPAGSIMLPTEFYPPGYPPLVLWDLASYTDFPIGVRSCGSCDVTCTSTPGIVVLPHALRVGVMPNTTDDVLFHVRARVRNASAVLTAAIGVGTCGVISCSTSGSSSISLPVAIQTTDILTFKDAVVVLPNGMAKSAWSSAINVSSVLCPQPPCDRVSMPWPQSAMEDAVRLAAYDPPGGVKPFAMTITSGVNVTLVMDRRKGVALPSGTRVLMANTDALVHWISVDGSMLHFQVPDAALLCSSADGSCGYMNLTLVSPLSSDAHPLSTCAKQLPRIQANSSCPPYCPNAFPDAVIALDGQLQPAMEMSDGFLRPLPWSNKAGFFVTADCIDPQYSRKDADICLNATLPESRSCPFGSGAFCRSCPTGALCPGGYRAWPLPGYFSDAEESNMVVSCSSPAVDRCKGWDATVGRSACGSGYSGYTCAACASSYYTTFDGVCNACPSTGSFWEKMLPYALLVGAALGVAAFAFALVLLVSKLVGGSMNANGERFVGLITWSFTVLQVVSSISQTSSPDLPEAVAVGLPRAQCLPVQGPYHAVRMFRSVFLS